MKKADVKIWLDKHGLVFTEMSDAEKLHMRKTLGICGAATAASDYTLPCSFTPMKNGRCSSHGGKTPGGMGLPQWKHGRYSKYMPADVLEKAKEAAADPHLHSMNEEIHLLDARLKTLLGRIDTKGGAASWMNLHSVWMEYLEAQKSNDPDEIARTAKEIHAIIQAGMSDAVIWGDIQRTIENRVKVVMAETKRKVTMHQVATYDQVMNLVVSMAEIIKFRLGGYMEKGLPVDNKLMKDLSGDVLNIITPPSGDEK